MGLISISALLYILIPLLILIPAVIGIWLITSGRNKNLGKILVMPLILGAIFAVAVFISIFFIFSEHAGILVAAVFIMGTLVAVISACALWGVLKKKFIYIPVCICMALCIIIPAAVLVSDAIDDSIPIISESDSLLYDYIPYGTDSKVAELDEESTLSITDDVPKMDGATAMYPVYSAFAKAVYPKELISENFVYGDYLTCNTTSKAYERIVTGEADIIFVAAPSEEQIQFAKDNGVELVYTPILKEAFVFFVNGRNPIDDISMSQIKGIYSGEITQWSDLGIERLGDIRAFQREEGSGSQSALIKLMDGTPLMTPPEEDIVSGMMGIITRTADYKNYKNAIGYSFRFYSTEMVANDQIKLLSIDGIAPTAENIENGTYPMTSYFYAVTRSDADENTRKLVEWIRSEQGQELIEKTGYTPLSEDELNPDYVSPELPSEEEEALSEAELEELNAYRPDYAFGTCQDLRGEITLALFFVNDFESEWDDETAMKFIEHEALPGLAFMEWQAAYYGKDLKFEIEVYSDLYYDGDVITDMKGTGYATIDVLEQIAEEMGFRTDYGLYEDLAETHENSETICFALFNKNGSSYALNPKPDSGIDIAEHAIIFAHDLNSDHTEPVGSQASLFASNILYLYGAESLNSPSTRKTLAQFYCPNDVMLSARYNIDENDISEITAFYVGWTNELPNAFTQEGWN